MKPYDIATSYPVISHWQIVRKHNFENSSTLCGNHGNGKLNIPSVMGYNKLLEEYVIEKLVHA